MAHAVTSGRGVDVTVRGIAAGGSGVGDLPDGRVVFVPRTAPGDRARIRVEKEKARWAVGSLQRLVAPGPDRVDPPCPLYAQCGGCQLQHLAYERQLEWKGRFVADALSRLGGVEGVAPPEVVPSPETVGYRTRMSFTLRRLKGGRVVAGLHGLGRPAHVVDVKGECVLPDPGLSAVWVRLRDRWGPGAERLPRGGRLRLTLRSAPPAYELLVEGGDPGWVPEALAGLLPELVSIRHVASSSGADATGGDDTGAGGLGTAFEQVNPGAARLLRAHVVEVAGEGAGAVDAYCGTGELAAALVGAGWSVLGIEVDPFAAERAEARNGVRVVRGRVEEALAEHLPAELLIVNPPRSGLDGAVPRIVLGDPPPHLIYVSCDPATLSRDVKALSDAYEIRGLRSFDLFPQTAHVETVALLEVRADAR